MYYATKRTNNSTRVVGLVTVVAVNAAVFWVAASGFGAAIINEIVDTEVAIIEMPEIEEEPPPPPPPVEVELPPPPPSAILPDFIPERPAQSTAIDAPLTKDPPPPRETPPPPKFVPPPVKPKPNQDRFNEMLTKEYPAASIRAEEEGTVRVSMCMSIDGKASNVQLVRSSGFPRLDEATVKNVGRLRFSPAKGSDGKPIAWCDPPYQFDVQWKVPER